MYGRAVGDHKLEKFSRLLMAMEIRSTKFYWHMMVGAQHSTSR